MNLSIVVSVLLLGFLALCSFHRRIVEALALRSVSLRSRTPGEVPMKKKLRTAGQPIPILQSYSQFKKAIAKYREARRHCVYFDVAAYFNRIYHHELVTWCENVGAAPDDVKLFGRFLREPNASIFLPMRPALRIFRLAIAHVPADRTAWPRTAPSK
jgi:hypothetical protein